LSQVGTDFHDRLSSLLSSEPAEDVEDKIINLLQVISTHPVHVNLGGYFNLDKSINIGVSPKLQVGTVNILKPLGITVF